MTLRGSGCQEVEGHLKEETEGSQDPVHIHVEVLLPKFEETSSDCNNFNL